MSPLCLPTHPRGRIQANSTWPVTNCSQVIQNRPQALRAGINFNESHLIVHGYIKLNVCIIWALNASAKQLLYLTKNMRADCLKVFPDTINTFPSKTKSANHLPAGIYECDMNVIRLISLAVIPLENSCSQHLDCAWHIGMMFSDLTKLGRHAWSQQENILRLKD